MDFSPGPCKVIEHLLYQTSAELAEGDSFGLPTLPFSVLLRSMIVDVSKGVLYFV